MRLRPAVAWSFCGRCCEKKKKKKRFVLTRILIDLRPLLYKEAARSTAKSER